MRLRSRPRPSSATFCSCSSRFAHFLYRHTFIILSSCLHHLHSHVPSHYHGRRTFVPFRSLRPSFFNRRSIFSNLQSRDNRLQPKCAAASLHCSCWQVFGCSSCSCSFDHRQCRPSHSASVGRGTRLVSSLLHATCCESLFFFM